VDRTAYWESIYTTRSLTDVSWYEASPDVSLRRVLAALEGGARSVIDVGGGASRLVDSLVDSELGLDRIAVLDASQTALDEARNRLGASADRIEWLTADVTMVETLGSFDVWHDRAVFHFLAERRDRERYVALCERTVAPDGVAIVATFAPDGPEMCSGLPVCRYDASDLAQECGPKFDLMDAERHVHVTPQGVMQPFLYASFRRLSDHRVLTSL